MSVQTFASLLRKQHSALVPTITITKLSFENCDISDDGIQALAHSLRGCRFYKDKNYSPHNNNSRFGGLEELSLGYNHISDVGCIHLADALKENNVLTYLDLIHNYIGWDGGSAICKVLESYNDTLSFIDLSDNPCENQSYNTNWTIGELCKASSISCRPKHRDPTHHYNDRIRQFRRQQQHQQEPPKRVDATEKEKYYQQIKVQKILQFLYLKELG